MKNTIKVRPVLVVNHNSHQSNVMLWKHCRTNKLSLWEDWFSMDKKWYGFDIVFISLDPDDKIEVGEKVYIELGGDSRITEVIGFRHGEYNVEIKEGYASLKSLKKVITTQDQIPESYIQQFIEEYNKGEVKDIKIEMEDIYDEETIASASGFSLKVPKNINYGPKLTNGFVNILKDTSIIYTEEDVYALLQASHSEVGKVLLKDMGLKKWFKLNKKI